MTIANQFTFAPGSYQLRHFSPFQVSRKMLWRLRFVESGVVVIEGLVTWCLGNGRKRLENEMEIYSLDHKRT